MGMKYSTAAKLIKDAFFEGWESYETPCCPYADVEDEWAESGAKDDYDRLMRKAVKAGEHNAVDVDAMEAKQ